MKLRDIQLGTRAIKRIPLPLVNRANPLTGDLPELASQRLTDASAAFAAGQQPTPDHVDVGVRALTPDELADVYSKASEFARSKGGEARDTDPIYNLGLHIYVCAIACVDPDTNPADPDPFFGKRGDLESAALELLSSSHIGRDGIAYLANAQGVWQDLISPSAMRMSPRQLVDAVAKLGSEDTQVAFDTFLALGPKMQWDSVRFMASQLALLLTPKSSGTSTSSTTSSSGGEASTQTSEPAS